MEQPAEVGTTIILVALMALPVVAVLGGVSGFIWWIVAKQKKEAMRIQAMTPAEHELRDATTEYQTTVAAADRVHAAEFHAYQAGIANAERELAAAQQFGSRALTRYDGLDSSIVLYEDRIAWAPAGGQWTTFALESGVRATVDSSGSIHSSERSTITRMAAGGALMGKAGVVAGAAARKTDFQDLRELYLLVEGTTFSLVTACRPQDGAWVRQFAASIVNAGHQAHTLQTQRPGYVAQATAAIEAARAATAQVAAAQQAAEAARAATGRIEAAQLALTIETGAAATAGTDDRSLDSHPRFESPTT